MISEIVEYLAEYKKDNYSTHSLSEKYIETVLIKYNIETRIIRRVDYIDKCDIYRMSSAIGILDYHFSYF